MTDDHDTEHTEHPHEESGEAPGPQEEAPDRDQQDAGLTGGGANADEDERVGDD